MKPSPHAQSLEQTRLRSKDGQDLPRAITVPTLERELVEWTIAYGDNDVDTTARKDKKNKQARIRNGSVETKLPVENLVARQTRNGESKLNIDNRQKDLCKDNIKSQAVEDINLYKPFERQTRVCNWVRENNDSFDITSLQKTLPMAMEHLKQIQPSGCRSFCESKQQENIRKLREKADLKIRQEKLALKLNFDHVDFQRLLTEANQVINTLEAKLDRRKVYLQNRAKKETELVDLTDDLRKERDKKLGEYRVLMRNVNEVLADKEADIDNWEKRRLDAEGSYTREIQKEHHLNKKIEARERQIETLRIKLMKAKKWKDDARQ